MKVEIWRVIIILIFGMNTMTSYAQLQIRPINHLSSSISSNSARVNTTRDTVDLPFWDDFSFSNITADTSLWESNTGTLINGTLGKSAPTVNVASFDGNDLFGNPHNPGGVGSDTVDVLTSQPINLEAVKLDKRDSVWFSFYWQMQGWGEAPEQRDFLMIQFLDKNGTWNEERTLLGSKENIFDSFKKESIQVDHEDYFHSGFQFRFVSVGNSLGPYDAWHIDYVYLNQDRSPLNESLEDRATADPPTPIFSEYTMIPYDVLFDFPDTIYRDISFALATLENRAQNVEFEYTLARYEYPNTDSAKYIEDLYYIEDLDDNFQLPPLGRNTNFIPALNHSYFDKNYDSLFIQTELIFLSADSYFVKSIDGPSDAEVITPFVDENYNYRLNDTIRSYFEIHETLAYDDGSAEYAAGLNKNESELAIYFKTPSQDTLTSIDIYFPQISRPPADAISPSGERIILKVLKKLSNEPVDELRSQEFIIPGGAGLNMFDRFTFDVPIIVSGEFYVTFQQLTNEYIGIGLDNNSTLGTSKISVKIEEEWEQNLKVEGMLMMRPIFEDSDFVVAGVVDNRNLNYSVYPNPADYSLTIQGELDRYELYNVSGKLLKKGQSNRIQVSDLLDGIYLLKIQRGKSYETKKVQIQH